VRARLVVRKSAACDGSVGTCLHVSQAGLVKLLLHGRTVVSHGPRPWVSANMTRCPAAKADLHALSIWYGVIRRCDARETARCRNV